MRHADRLERAECNRCFEDSEKSKIELLNFMLHSLFVWTGAFHIYLLSSFSHFAEFCISCCL
jgi:hypothetical protein